MNITLSAEDELIEKAREIAQQQGTSLNELVRGYLRNLVGKQSGAASAQELLTLMREHPGRLPEGRAPTRADAYEDLE